MTWPVPDTPLSASPHKDFRFRKTLRFVTETLPAPARLLDLGASNELSRHFEQAGYDVQNTEGDLDEVPEVAALEGVEAVTAFEILEHLVSPYNVLREIHAPRLFASVPLRLWFSKAYRNPTDPWDRHFHEFEDWQFDWLLEKAGWKIVRREHWKNETASLTGIRPLLRRLTPRWYIVEAVR